MIHDGSNALVVDPGDAVPVSNALQELDLTLTGILVTHHHADHTSGLPELQRILKGPIWGPAQERLPVAAQKVQQNDLITWGDLTFQVLDVPGHTAGHVAYHLAEGGAVAPLLFSGDTLFSAGCGRIFEGTPSQMYKSLRQIADLPPETRLCCAHEYTLNNLRFALEVEPGNAVIRDQLITCEQLRHDGIPTLPTTLGLELQINPFLRCAEPTLISAALKHDDSVTGAESAFAVLREWKNTYR